MLSSILVAVAACVPNACNCCRCASKRLYSDEPDNTEPKSGMRRVEFLTHDISVHVPHHVNSKIPWYNLRMAHASLQKNWGQVRSRSALLLYTGNVCSFADHTVNCRGVKRVTLKASVHLRIAVLGLSDTACFRPSSRRITRLDNMRCGHAHTPDCLPRST